MTVAPLPGDRVWLILRCPGCGDRWPVATDESVAETCCPECGRRGERQDGVASGQPATKGER